jgi:hypothetical protein
VATERIEQGRDAAAADERHDNVDGIGRLDLRAKLAPENGFARGVGQQRCIEQRYQGLCEGGPGAIGSAPNDGVEHLRRIEWDGRPVGSDQLAETAQKLPGHGQPDLDPLLVSNAGERLFDLAAEVKRDPVGRLGRAECPLLRGQVLRKSVELDLQAFRDEGLVESGPSSLIAEVNLRNGPAPAASGVRLQLMTARERLHQIVDALPEPDAEQILRAFEHWRDDPVSRALAAAPFDDEPETDEERAAVEAGRDAMRRGDVVSAAEVWDER